MKAVLKMKIARAINSYLDENYYGLSRGIFPKYKKMEMAFIIKIYRKCDVN